jgi:hypothetical protein
VLCKTVASNKFCKRKASWHFNRTFFIHVDWPWVPKNDFKIKRLCCILLCLILLQILVNPHKYRQHIYTTGPKIASHWLALQLYKTRGTLIRLRVLVVFHCSPWKNVEILPQIRPRPLLSTSDKLYCSSIFLPLDSAEYSYVTGSAVTLPVNKICVLASCNAIRGRLTYDMRHI